MPYFSSGLPAAPGPTSWQAPEEALGPGAVPLTTKGTLSLCLLGLLLLPVLAEGKKTYGPYRASVVNVIDGDTVKVQIAVWPRVTYEVNLRLSGVNTPEKRGRVPACEKQAGQEATTFTQS